MAIEHRIQAWNDAVAALKGEQWWYGCPPSADYGGHLVVPVETVLVAAQVLKARRFRVATAAHTAPDGSPAVMLRLS